LELKRMDQPGMDVIVSIPMMVRRQGKSRPGETIFRDKKRGVWKSTTWADLDLAVRRAGTALRSIGFERGDAACVVAETSVTWAICDLAILSAGGISVGIYTTDDAERTASVIRDCGAKLVFVGDDEQLDKVLRSLDACPSIELIVVLESQNQIDLPSPLCVPFLTFVHRADAFEAANPGEWEAGIGRILPSDPAIVIHTSGTTGAPKSVVLTHRNLSAQLMKSTGLLDASSNERLAFLPMPHFIERILGLYLSLQNNIVSNYVESAETVRANFREIRPAFICASPVFWERLRSQTIREIEGATRLQGWLCRSAMRLRERVLAARAESRGIAWIDRAAAAIAAAVVLRAIRSRMGLAKLRAGWIGGAPVVPGLLHWYEVLGVELLEFYGLAESSGLAFACSERLASSGEVMIAANSEIALRGDFVASRCLPELRSEKSGEAGWYRTGDRCQVEKGVMHVSGRLGSEVVLSSGRSVDPAGLERCLRQSRYISDAIVVGDQREFLGCLVMIDHENVDRWARDHRLAFKTFADLARSEALRELVGQEIQRLTARQDEPIKSFAVIERRLADGDPELTPLMHLRRPVEGLHQHLIEELYGSTMSGSREGS
jgi:long-chain acyl-CoA synthetase